MDEVNPALLEGEDFHDWISKHLAYRQDWSKLLTSEHILRTRQSVDGLLSILRDQLNEHPEQNAWYLRTSGMKSMAEARLRQIDRHIDGTGLGRQVSAWKATLHQIVGLIIDEGSDELVDALEKIRIPVGDLNLGEWYDRRLEKRGAA